jgi:hypothetical protein
MKYLRQFIIKDHYVLVKCCIYVSLNRSDSRQVFTSLDYIWGFSSMSLMYGIKKKLTLKKKDNYM